MLIKALNKIGFTFTELNTIGEVCEEIEKKYNRIFLISFIENKFKIPVEAEESISVSFRVFQSFQYQSLKLEDFY